MKQYIVSSLYDLLSGARYEPDVRFGVYEVQPHGNTAVAFTYTREMAERLVQLLNDDEMRREVG